MHLPVSILNEHNLEDPLLQHSSFFRHESPQDVRHVARQEEVYESSPGLPPVPGSGCLYALWHENKPLRFPTDHFIWTRNY